MSQSKSDDPVQSLFLISLAAIVDFIVSCKAALARGLRINFAMLVFLNAEKIKVVRFQKRFYFLK